MKYEIYEKAQALKPQEPTVRLRLTAVGKEVLLSVVDSVGRTVMDGALIVFEPDGSFCLLPAVDPGLGLLLTESGRLVEKRPAPPAVIPAAVNSVFPLDI